ncbi:hypothetical protein C0989_010373, partial [Termitomyces sp. Mn162]
NWFSPLLLAFTTLFDRLPLLEWQRVQDFERPERMARALLQMTQLSRLSLSLGDSEVGLLVITAVAVTSKTKKTTTKTTKTTTTALSMTVMTSDLLLED